VGREGEVEQAAVVTDGASPRIAWNGKEHLLVCSTVSGMAGQARSWLRMDTAAKPLSKPGFVWGGSRYSTCAMSEEKGWVIVCHEGPPNWWGRSVGVQRILNITPEGKVAAGSPTRDAYPEPHYDAKARTNVIPGNWLDTSLGKKSHGTRGSAGISEIWPYGGSAVARDGQYCVAVWQRYHTGGASGMDLINGDILAARVDGWKPVDKEGVAVAASAADECNPALTGNGAGMLLCVYEKVVEGRTQIAARTIQTR
jgi:hypothetical protein